MRTMVRIRFDSSHIPGGAAAILGPAGCGPDVATVEDVPVLRQMVVWVTLERSDPRLPLVRQLLKPYDDDPLELHEDRYTDQELESAPLLFVPPNWQCKIDGGVEWGMTFDFSQACPACGTPSRQTSAAFVDGDHLSDLEGHRAGVTYRNHYLVDEGLSEALVNSGATGLLFHHVYAILRDKRQVKLRWKQLTARRTLPRMSPSTTGFARPRACEVCNRNGYCRTIEEPTRIVYKASDLRDLDDVNLSWENYWFSVLEPDPRESLLSFPWLLVTPKVWRVFRDAGVTSFDWLPIRVEDA